MRVLLISSFAEGGYFAWWLKQEGHSVDCVLKDRHYASVMGGLVEWRESAESPESYDLVLLDMSGHGPVADEARLVTPTLGGSTLADKLESDRVFGIEYMEKCGIRVPPWEAFDNPADAIRLVKKTKKRYVYKAVGHGDCSTTYVSKSPEDLAGYIGRLFEATPSKQFILQEFVKGVECSTEMWLNRTGYYAVNHTLEAKKLLTGDLGPNCGCAGSVVWMPTLDTPLFKRGLKRSVGHLQADGYCGMIDLNTIVTEDEVWGLEWTPRCGYDATANLIQLLPMELGQFLFTIAAGRKLSVFTPKHRFAASTRIYIPPYPAELPDKFYRKDVPIEGLTVESLKRFHPFDARYEEESGKFATAGVNGWVGTPLGVGDSIGEAFDSVTTMIHGLKVPDMGWRSDIAENVAKRYAELSNNGWLRQEFGKDSLGEAA